MVKHNNFNDLAQKVWATQGVDQKRAILLEMVEQFQFKKKKPEFVAAINSEYRASRLDQIAANIMLCDTDKTIQPTRR